MITTAAAVRIPLYPVLGDRVPFITLFMVMLPLVLLVRAGPFFAASLLGLLAIGIAFRDRFFAGGAEGTVDLALFGLAAAAATVSAWLAQRAEKRRRSADAMLRAFVDEAPACKWITGPDGRIVYANQAMADALGRPADQIIGRTHAELLPAKLAELAVSHIKAVRESGQPRESFEEVEPLGGAGARRILDWRRFVLKLGKHDHVLVAGMANDVTEKVRTERALRDSEARLRTLIEQLPAGVGVMDRTGRWVLTNRTMDLYVPNGIPSTQIDRAERWRFWDDHGELVPPEQWPGQRALRGEAVVPGLEGLYAHDDGREIWMRVSAVPLRNDSADIVGATCVVLDIDLAKRFRDSLERELAKRTEEVQRAAKAAAAAQRLAAVGTMASGLAHDMKNVLLPLSARMDSVLAAPGLEGEAHTDLTVVVALIDHLRQMARNLELFARDPEQEGTEGVTLLAPWCRRVQGLLESSLNSGGHRADRWMRLKCDVPEGLPTVAIAPHRLTQSVLNLVHNARDAILARKERREEQNGPIGTISVEARATPDGSAVTLRVIDDGLGMDDETKRRCVEPFFTTKDRPAAAGLGGSGLGLALVQAVAERAGGQLQVESEAGKGTTVTMVLPVAAPTLPTATPAPIGRARVSIEDKRTRAFVVETLRSLRYETIDGHPEQDSPSTAWVTDGIGAKPEQAALFLQVRPGQRVVVLGGDESWRSVGAIVCERTGASATLRTALTEQLS